MRLLSTSVLLSMIFVLGVVVTPAGAETFNTNLMVGSTGADVTLLQQFLVSKGFLEMPPNVYYGYFGPLTKAALAKWQTSRGISPAVGYFGPISRAAIALEMGTTATATATSTSSTPSPLMPISSEFFPSIETDTPSAPGVRVNQVMLFRATPFEVRPGDSIALDGSGFSKTSNEIYFNDTHPLAATSTDGITLKIPVPTNLAEGEYRLSVSNVLGSSDNPDIRVLIKVTSNPKPGPIIESASIVDDMVTLVGSGFTSANHLITTLGDFSGLVSSNGTTLTFRITDLSMYDKVRQLTLGNYQVALWIYIQNEHGINKEPYKLETII